MRASWVSEGLIRVGHVHFMFFHVGYAQITQCEHSIWWNTGLGVGQLKSYPYEKGGKRNKIKSCCSNGGGGGTNIVVVLTQEVEVSAVLKVGGKS